MASTLESLARRLDAVEGEMARLKVARLLAAAGLDARVVYNSAHGRHILETLLLLPDAELPAEQARFALAAFCSHGPAVLAPAGRVAALRRMGRSRDGAAQKARGTPVLCVPFFPFIECADYKRRSTTRTRC